MLSTESASQVCDDPDEFWATAAEIMAAKSAMRRDRRRIIGISGRRSTQHVRAAAIWRRELTKKMAFVFLLVASGVVLASGLQLAPHAVLGPGLSISTDTVTANCAIPAGAELLRVEETAASVPVSYTHLTLPTIYSV